MDFNDTPEEAAFRKEAAAWLDANADRLPPGKRRTGGLDRDDLLPEAKAWQAKKADAGWACITWPKEYGGRGAPGIHSVIF
jgi:alkylation response protein AidB-like acyl-CoA dehydrogenase